MPPKEHEIITGVVIVVIVFLLAGFFILLLVTLYNQRKKRYIRDKQDMESKFRQELLQAQLEIQEETFRNISQEIHDNIGQALSFVKLNINMIDLDERSNTENRLAESKKLLTKAIQDLRDLARTLDSGFINETGLINAIEQQLQFLQKTGVYTIEFAVEGTVEKMQVQRELVMFRIVQELLNNIVKHAAATAISVMMVYQSGSLIVTVADNGKGFDADKGSRGLGLRNIISRAKLINGDVDFKSTTGSGTTVTIQLFKSPTADGKI